MLVLTRERDQSIVIGDDVVVTLLESDRHKAKIGIVAPLDLRVDRSEVRDRIAAKGGPDARASPPPSRHVDTIARLRCDLRQAQDALRMVLARGPRYAWTDRKWTAITSALGTEPGP